jgi:hypothetical protein
MYKPATSVVVTWNNRRASVVSHMVSCDSIVLASHSLKCLASRLRLKHVQVQKVIHRQKPER